MLLGAVNTTTVSSNYFLLVCNIRNPFIKDSTFCREQLAFREFARKLGSGTQNVAKNAKMFPKTIVKALWKEHESGFHTNLGVDLKECRCRDVANVEIWDLISTK